MTTAQIKLLAPITATGIHAITGQPYVEGTIEAGALVRNVDVHSVHSPDGVSHLTKLDVSTDGGVTWFANETWDVVETSE